MSEMSQTADHLLVIGRGRIIAAGPVQQVIDSVAGGAVRVRSPRAGELAAALAADGATVTSPEAGMLDVSGTTAALPDSLTQCSHTGWDATASRPFTTSSMRFSSSFSRSSLASLSLSALACARSALLASRMSGRRDFRRAPMARIAADFAPAWARRSWKDATFARLA